ncbi:MAG: hypothetical protein Q8P57_05205 [Candidatus Pacearchaeota archaeon]|nr:hypothetical protein [Candidatus Pacearchaeota archaeon]
MAERKVTAYSSDRVFGGMNLEDLPEGYDIVGARIGEGRAVPLGDGRTTLSLNLSVGKEGVRRGVILGPEVCRQFVSQMGAGTSVSGLVGRVVGFVTDKGSNNYLLVVDEQ